MALPPETAGIAEPMREALVVLGAAALVIPLFHRLRLSPVLGYMLVGMLAGPDGLGAFAGYFSPLGWVTLADRAQIEPVAALGVVLLMFTIGLEMSWERIASLGRLVFGLGALQVVLSSVALGLGLRALAVPAGAALVCGLALAMSSTAIVTQVLSDERRMTGHTGRTCFAVLLGQDLAVVPILFLLGSLAGRGDGLGALGIATAKALAAMVALALVGRRGLRPLFRSVARTQSPELFMAACLLVVLATGLAAERAGLSMAIGALLAGVLLAETEYRRQVEVTVEPFKGLLLGVFLISIGLRLDLRAFAAAPASVLLVASGFLVVKTGLIWGLARLFGVRGGAALQSALLLAPGGEFGFVLIGLGSALGLLPRTLADAIFLVTALSMAAIPAMSWLGRKLEPARRASVSTGLLPAGDPAMDGVIIAGFGRVGRTVAALLRVHEMSWVALDQDVGNVSERRRAGDNVFYGDCAQVELLRRVGLATARALVVTIDHRERADAIVHAARAERPDLLIVARARDAAHAAHLYATGASDAVPETVEASLQLAEAVLVDLGVPMGPVLVSIHEQRARFQADIKRMAPAAEVRPRGVRRLRPAPEDG